MRGLLEAHWFQSTEARHSWLASVIEEPEDYWDFPLTMLAFGSSLKNSKLWKLGDTVFRTRGKQATLINWFCKPWELKDVIEIMEKDFPKIKSLNWGKKALDQTWAERGQKVPEFKVTSPYNFVQRTSFHSKKTRNNIIRKYTRGHERCHVLYDYLPRRRKVQELFNKWVKHARKRHFMVVKGHYLAYIDLLYKGYGHTITFWKDKELVAICGYEVFKKKAQITLMKNAPGNNYFPVYFWIEVVSHLSSLYEEVYCGSTAESLKRMLGFEEYESWKLKL